MYLLFMLKNAALIWVFNFFKKSRIHSLSVSAKAIAHATEVEVLRGVNVDSASCIGSYTYIGRHTNITKASIGRYCSIANNVSIGQGEHLLDRVSTSSMFYDDPWATLTAGDCIIDSDVWIGVDAVILRGVSIGFGAVVAANAVVTKDVPPFAIVAGIPARVIRFRFSESVQDVILASKWWESDRSEASEIVRALEMVLSI